MSSKAVIVLLLASTFCNVRVNSHLHLDWDSKRPPFNPEFYENLLNPELCEEQLSYMANNGTQLRLQFLESGLRIPRSILMGNTLDLGNYFQCLQINEDIGSSVVEGKYCMINAPISGIELPDFPSLPDLPDLPDLPEWLPEIPDWIDFNPYKLRVNEETATRILAYKELAKAVNAFGGIGIEKLQRNTSSALSNLQFQLAVCVPKACTIQQGINGLLFNLSAIGFQYEENFCRVTNDKPWVPADTIAVVILSLIGVITILSTGYDVWHVFIVQSDDKTISTLCRSFSMYTNARHITTFSFRPGSLHCIDGIRALAMAWIIIGHTFHTLPPHINLLETFDWTLSIKSLWITAAPISVDTFFVLSGLLLVYTTCGKMTSMKLVKNLHMFYLYRLLRMFPLLAAAVLFQASLLHRVADGPLWNLVADNTENCRTYWWSTLLYVQNLVNTESMCLPHSWYLAIDIQLHIFSPIVLFWVLGSNRKAAWTALAAGLLAFQIPATAYNFIKEFPGSSISPNRIEDPMYFMVYHYLNTLTRASPFFVGMIYGYLLHLWRGRTLELSKSIAILLWIGALALTTIAFFATHPMKSFDWDNQTVDSLVNSFIRPLWAMGLGWIIFACTHGYGGPVNWFLSLQIWKLPSRISYGMYLFHYPIMFVISGTYLAPIFYSTESTVYLFVGHFVLAIIVSFIMTLVIDYPCATLVRLCLGDGPKKPTADKRVEDLKNIDVNVKNEFLNGEIITIEKEDKNNNNITLKF